ncbi:GntR family transcriptional regulator [Streptomyces sp. NPDC059718]
MTSEGVQPYMRIVGDVRDKIRSGQLAPEEKLPSTREMADAYEVALGTVQSALKELRNLGLIYSIQGRGTYVSAVPPVVEDDATARALRSIERQLADLARRVQIIEGEREQGR